MEGTCWYCKKVGHPWFKCFSRPEGWAPPGMKPPSGERAQGGAVQGSGAQGLSANLLSVRRLQKSKAEVTFGRTSCRAKLGKKKLVKDGSLKGLEVKGGVKEIGSCPTCLETKFSKFPFNSTTGPAKIPLALVHMDVVGPTRALSLSGSRYFLTIVDDHTRAVWVYPLKSKEEPKTREEALNGPNGEKWKASEDEEFGSLIENETWDLCDLPPGKKAITSKMIYRHKYGPEGELIRYKSRLVARGFQQTKGKDYDEVFAPVGKGTTLRVLLAIAALLGWKIRQMHIVTAFLNGIIMEEVYMKQPEGLDDGSGRVCRLKKAIYGLKQAPRAWYHKLEEALLAGGFKKSECDPSLFLLQEKDEILMLLVYVNDILLFSASTALLDSAEQMLEMQFKCSKMGEVKYYLGMHVERDVEKGVLRLHQRKYCEGLAEKYGLQDGGKPATPLPLGFTVEPCADEEVVVKADGTSIGGYVCLLGGGAVSWRSKKQNEVGLSSCETEYMALHHWVKEVVWLRRLLEELGVGQEEPTVVFCNNESAVKLAKNACLHGLTKDIRPKWHWVRRLLDKEVRLEIVKTHQQAADIFTKRLAEADHWKGMKLAGMSVH
ncbi:hypothetical protein CLOM_g8014 [Closterium sp. NIES-68]|nr:hypothetical protein CLOM_g8014 [Closterium sp. NIES-68]